LEWSEAESQIMRVLGLVFGAALLATQTASAHVVFEQNQAEAGTGYKAVMKVGHGCAGSATIALRVRIPDGVVQVKPTPKSGWALSTRTAKYAHAYDGLHGVKLTEGVTEITWSGGKLEDAWYDEFTFIATLPATPGPTLLFPVLQTCEKGQNDWSEDPTRSSVRATHPAPYVTLTPADDPHAHH
jgi:uncharacterized protein YcnI